MRERERERERERGREREREKERERERRKSSLSNTFGLVSMHTCVRGGERTFRQSFWVR